MHASRLALLVCLVAAWPALGASSAPPASLHPTYEQVRQTVQDAAVRVDVEAGDSRSVCTGWIGYSEEARSAAYTAAHCYREGARYRLTLAGAGTVYATYLTRWDGLDLMALWIPRGRLRALRGWKPLPDQGFRVLYVLNERGTGLRLVEVSIPRVYWEIRFENHPLAVALPLASVPGTSGAPVVDLADGMLVGMVVGYVSDRPEVAAVVPAQSIYDALATAARR